MHIPMAVCSNNAKSCYERIVLIVSLCCLSTPKGSVQSMLSMIHGMQHHLCSSYGDSKTSQGRHQWGVPIAGIGQGNGACPLIWAAVSTPLFQILMVKRYFAQVICAIILQNWDITGFGFVDNMDLCTTAASHKVADMVQQMQLSLKLWASLLQATGGALVLEKCFWYLINQTWTNTGWRYNQLDPNYSLRVPDDMGTMITIPQLPSS